jgi:hypothetical protein
MDLDLVDFLITSASLSSGYFLATYLFGSAVTIPYPHSTSSASYLSLPDPIALVSIAFRIIYFLIVNGLLPFFYLFPQRFLDLKASIE